MMLDDMGSFILEKITEENLNEAISLVEEKEESSIALMSRMIDGSWKNSIFDYYCVYQKGKALKMVCVIMRSHAGLVQHCIKNLDELEKNTMFEECLKPLFYGKSLYCIMGEKRSTMFLASVAKKYSENVLSEKREYLLLLYNPINLPCELHENKNGYECVKCGIFDSEKLFELQKKYDIVEVLPDGKSFNGELCMRNLELALKTQIVYGIKEGKRFVAKAGTNAQGKNFCQLGGVYTEEEFRGRGMARFLVKNLAEKIESLGKNTALFVRTENASAKAAYRKAGFVYQNDYLILYFR